MKLIERYLFRQMLGPTFWALGALGALGLLSQSLSGLDIIVDQGQSALVFLKVTLLGMPQVISLLAPIAVFVAAFMTFNRLQTEQEAVVCAAGGMSRWGVISPAMRLAAVMALVTLAVNLWVQPWSSRAMRDQIFAMRADLAATMVREGEFTQPAPGLTVYAEEKSRQGVIKNLFIHRVTERGEFTLSAREGQIIRDPSGTPNLVVLNASTQTLDNGVLQYMTFPSYSLELAELGGEQAERRYKPRDRYMRELFFPDLSIAGEREMAPRLLAEAHSRISGPIYILAAMTMAIGAVLGGGFSRLGYGRRIAITAAVATVVRILGFVAQAGAEDVVALNVLQYLVPVAGCAWGLSMILRSSPKRASRTARSRSALAGAA